MSIRLPKRLFFLFILPLSGCFHSDPTEDVFNTYLERLANVQEQKTQPFRASPTPELPEKRELRASIEDIRMGLLDAYELRKCGLFQLIAERNSILGKVQDEFHIFHYEVNFSHTLKKCLNSPMLDKATHAELLAIQTLKQEQLLQRYWNTVTVSKEWNRQLQPFPIMLPMALMPSATPTYQAVRYFSDIQLGIENDQLPADVDPLFTHQKALSQTRYLSQLLYSLQRSTDWLTATTAQLKQHDKLIICGLNRNQTKAKYLQNVFFRFYIEQIQPYLAKLDSSYQELQPFLGSMYNPVQRTNKNGFTTYYTYYLKGAVHDNFKKATIEHVRYWQSLFKRCNFAVGRQ